MVCRDVAACQHAVDEHAKLGIFKRAREHIAAVFIGYDIDIHVVVIAKIVAKYGNIFAYRLALKLYAVVV